jgi:hypothetical protein
MMIVTNDNVKRTLQQMQDMLLQAVSPTPQPHALGVAISFITTTVILTQQLKSEGRVPAAVEADQKQVVADWIAAGRLTVTQNIQVNSDNHDPDLANLRHLRNCFGHGNWRYDTAAVTSDAMPIELQDWQKNRNTGNWEQTWEASVEAIDLINLAQRLLVITFNGLP